MLLFKTTLIELAIEKSTEIKDAIWSALMEKKQ